MKMNMSILHKLLIKPVMPRSFVVHTQYNDVILNVAIVLFFLYLPYVLCNISWIINILLHNKLKVS